MRHRILGRTNWQVSEIGYGTWGMGSWTGSDDTESLASMSLAIELGCNFFDTAWRYGFGHSERLVGEAARAHPDGRLLVATKVPPKNGIWPALPGSRIEDCFPSSHIREYVLLSLKNLGLPYIDLLQFHVWDDGWANHDEWQKEIDDLKRDGLIRAAGISVNDHEPENVLKTLETGTVDSVQVIYNIFEQAPQDQLFSACQELGIGVIARVPFDEGSLTGSLTEDSRWPEGDWRNRYFHTEKLRETIRRVEALKMVLPEQMTLAELALRWVLSDSRVSVVIPGMRRRHHVRNNLSISDGKCLSRELLIELQRHRWDRKSI